MFDEWSNFSVHVAMDNTVVIEDISKSIHNTNSVDSKSLQILENSPFIVWKGGFLVQLPFKQLYIIDNI